MQITAVGNSNIIAGVLLKLNNLRSETPNSWIVKTVVHSQTKQGYHSHLQINYI